MAFRFKQFALRDERCAQKVGTDGVLIGAWADVDAVRSVLDVGAGCGLVSLMIAQRTRNAQITAVEKDSEASEDCRLNFKVSPWSDRLELVNADFKAVEGLFDLIISNPPFFCGDLAAKGDARMLARQGISLNYFTLIEFASQHLTADGRLAFTSDMRHEKDIVFTAAVNRLWPRRICRVSGKEGRAPIRLLWEFCRNETESIKNEELAHRTSEGSYHPNYIELTHDFYVNL